MGKEFRIIGKNLHTSEGFEEKSTDLCGFCEIYERYIFEFSIACSHRANQKYRVSVFCIYIGILGR